MLALNDGDAARRLRTILDKNDLNEDDYDAVVDLVRGSSAIEEAERHAHDFADRARAELGSFPPSDTRTTLERLCDYVTARRA